MSGLIKLEAQVASTPALREKPSAAREHHHTEEEMFEGWLCCLSRPLHGADGSPTSSPSDELSEKLAPSPIDLLSDEGANFQDDQWQLMLREKLLQTQTAKKPFYDQLSRTATMESANTALTQLYTSHGLAQKIPSISATLKAIEPFAAAVTTLTQSHPEIACLVWGSIQLVLQFIVRFVSVFDEAIQMLQEISKTLPRFTRYVEILQTPRLHAALRTVYSEYIDFAFAVTNILQTNSCVAFFKVQWSAIGREFDQSKRNLLISRTEFEAEQRLANVEVQSQRHTELMARINSMGSSLQQETIVTVRTARNVLFTGRDQVLNDLHSILQPSFAAVDAGGRMRCSCVIHGLGGMGKTETALEYSYRYLSCYSHIFWLHAESSAALLSSFLEIYDKLSLGAAGINNEKMVKITLDWLSTTSDRWLLIFDNAEEPAMIQRLWPAGDRGAIIVTSQNADMIHVTRHEIHLQPMPPSEGSSLIQRYLRRGGSEQTAAENLSSNLGGLPIAIAHFAGYVAKSKCPIEQILESYRERYKSSQIWTAAPSATTSAYAHTLATVWDLAWQRLSPDARHLLELMAFLNPDMIPEQLFVGPALEMEGVTPIIFDSQEWEFWSQHRFNDAVGVLRERHLIERDTNLAEASLRIHRVLQRSILHRLDGDLSRRQSVFDEVVGMLRRQFPRRNDQKRGDTSHFPVAEKFFPHVLTLNGVYTTTEDNLAGNLEFVSILADAGSYAMENVAMVEGPSILEPGMRIAENMYEHDPERVRPILARIVGPLHVFNQYLGTSGREFAFKLSSRQLELTKELVALVPADEWTDLQHIQLGIGFIDKGVTLAQLDRMEEAGECFGTGLQCYQRAGNETTMVNRFAMIYSFQLWVDGTMKRTEKVREMSRRAIEIITKNLGPDKDLTLQTKTCSAIALFAIGDIAPALVLLKEVYEARLRLSGPNSQATLACQYLLAVAYQNTGELETAELYLRENLQNSILSSQWRIEDELRTKLRLSIVLQLQNRPSEAAQYRKQVFELSLKGTLGIPPAMLQDKTDHEIMNVFDTNVTLYHGRTTGKWSDGKHW